MDAGPAFSPVAQYTTTRGTGPYCVSSATRSRRGPRSPSALQGDYDQVLSIAVGRASVVRPCRPSIVRGPGGSARARMQPPSAHPPTSHAACCCPRQRRCASRLVAPTQRTPSLSARPPGAGPGGMMGRGERMREDCRCSPSHAARMCCVRRGDRPNALHGVHECIAYKRLTCVTCGGSPLPELRGEQDSRSCTSVMLTCE